MATKATDQNGEKTTTTNLNGTGVGIRLSQRFSWILLQGDSVGIELVPIDLRGLGTKWAFRGRILPEARTQNMDETNRRRPTKKNNKTKTERGRDQTENENRQRKILATKMNGAKPSFFPRHLSWLQLATDISEWIR